MQHVWKDSSNQPTLPPRRENSDGELEQQDRASLGDSKVSQSRRLRLSTLSDNITFASLDPAAMNSNGNAEGSKADGTSNASPSSKRRKVDTLGSANAMDDMSGSEAQVQPNHQPQHVVNKAHDHDVKDNSQQQKKQQQQKKSNEMAKKNGANIGNGNDNETNTKSKSNTNTNTNIPTKYPKHEINRKKSKHQSSKKVDPLVLSIRREIQMSCKFNDLANAIRVYNKALAQSIKIEPQIFYSLLNLCDGLGRSVHVGTPKGPTGASSSSASAEPQQKQKQPKNAQKEQQKKEWKKLEKEAEERKSMPLEEVSFEERRKFAFEIKEQMDRINLRLTETCYTALVKLLARSHELDEALKLVKEAENVQQCKPKLRMYTPLLMAYCENQQMVPALTLWHQILQQEALQPTERECIALLNCATATRHVNVVEYVITFVADEVPVPSKEFDTAVINWFGNDPNETAAAVQDETDRKMPSNTANAAIGRLLKAIRDLHKARDGELPPSMGPVTTSKKSRGEWIISPVCAVDTATGTLKDGCLQGFALKPCFISANAWERMEEMNATIVTKGGVEGDTSQFQGGRKGKKRRDFSIEEREERWTQFTNFLDKSFPGDRKVDVVVDGANVGYFETNFAGAPRHVDYNQIDWIVRHFLKAGKSVLLFLHERHFARHLMPSSYRPVVEQWQEWGILYRTPAGMNDDWFWMHAAMKYRSLVLTNDEMRDHHFQMLAPRMFLRWKDRQQIHFEFGDWEPVHPVRKRDKKNESAAAAEGGASTTSSEETMVQIQGRDVVLPRPPYRSYRKIILAYPEVYSRRVQRVKDGLAIPLAKQGDENRFLDGSHVASEDEPKDETYLCIRPATSSSS